MRNLKSIRPLFQNVFKRKLHSLPRLEALNGNQNCSSNWRLASLQEELKHCDPDQETRPFASIYKVPGQISMVEPQAYTPSVISIGPYHYESPELEEMERFKRKFFHRLFDPSCGESIGVDSVFYALKEMEHEARGHYSEEVELEGDKFVEMMLVDGCFVVELLRELEKYNFKHGSPLIERWMLPTLRRDLIKLENQLPMTVLQMLFSLTDKRSGSSTSLQQLAIRFFTPLLQRGSIPQGKDKATYKGKHMLDLFRSIILPETAMDAEKEWDENMGDPGLIDPQTNSMSQSGTTKEVEAKVSIVHPTKIAQEECLNMDEIETFQKEEASRIRSTRELIKAGMYIEKGQSRRPLAVDYGRNVLIIPPLFIDDYKGTVFRNLLAYEQRHRACKPHVTAYVFFLDGLINTAEDVKQLYCREVIQHSLGSDKDVAKLVNSICKGIARETKESYLHKVIWNTNLYLNTVFATMVAPMVHHYLGNLVVGIPTVFSLVALGYRFTMTDKGDGGNPDFTLEP